VVFLIILVIGWLIAKIITKAISAVLTRVGFDKAVERGGVKKALESSKYDASDILAKIVYYALTLFVLSTAFGVFGNNPVSTYLHAVIAYLPLVFVAIVIVIIASAIAAAAKALIENSLSGMSYAKVLGNVVSGLILAFGIIAALDQLHVATNVVNAVLYTALAALVGVVGGGGIRTMSGRWEAVAGRYDEEKPKIAESARNGPSVNDQARQAKDTAASNAGGDGSAAAATASGTAPTATKATPAAR
jgi:Conserved TM helix